MRLTIAFAALALLVASPTFARDYNPSSHGLVLGRGSALGDGDRGLRGCRPGYYRSTDGSLVHGPTRNANAAYGPVTADCRDGTHSYSHHHSGTCSGHGGVATWR